MTQTQIGKAQETRASERARDIAKETVKIYENEAGEQLVGVGDILLDLPDDKDLPALVKNLRGVLAEAIDRFAGRDV